MELMDDSHISERLLERCATDGFPADRPEITNHLISCDSCHDIYEAARINNEHAVHVPRQTPRQRQFLPFGFPGAVWAAAAGALLCLFYINPVRPRPSRAAQVVEITAVRGGQTVEARSDVPLVLKLDTTGLEVPAAVQVNIVNERGRSVWTGAARQEDSVWRTEATRGVSPGRYWVRIPDPTRPDELLREFQLDVK